MARNYETQALTVGADDGTPVTLVVPVGPIVEPTARGKRGWESIADRADWKSETRDLVTTNEAEASEVAEALDFYLGGHEVYRCRAEGTWVVGSKGYYHYVGA